MLIRVGSDLRISNPAHGQGLPASWRTLYELTKLDNDTWVRAEEEKRIHARQLNLSRRHLNREQKQTLIRDQLKETPATSDRQIAKGLGVHHSTVSSLRGELESTGEISQLNKTTGADGKEVNLLELGNLPSWINRIYSYLI